MVDGSNASVFPQYNFAQAGLYPDPTQWSNPYSSYNNTALPFPPGYVGSPVNAGTGQPIQSPPGTTLNSTPVSAAPTPATQPNNAQLMQNARNMASAISPISISTPGNGMGGGNVQQSLDAQGQMAARLYQNSLAQQQQQGVGGGSSGVSSSMLPASQSGGYQNALSLLANPGNPVTPGAAFNPATQTGGGAQGQGILNNFIQNWQQGGIGQRAAPGIGGGSSGVAFGANNPFFAALGGQR